MCVENNGFFGFGICHIAFHFITQRFNAFCDLRRMRGFDHFKGHITGNWIDRNIPGSLLLKEFIDGKRAIGAVHPFYFPLDLFHALLLLQR